MGRSTRVPLPLVPMAAGPKEELLACSRSSSERLTDRGWGGANFPNFRLG